MHEWHCTGEGDYSLNSDSAQDENFLRVVRISDARESSGPDHYRVDVGGMLPIPSDRRPLLAYTEPDYPEVQYFDPKIER